MIEKKIGFIGAGKMAGAIIGGIMNSKLVQPENIMASAKSQATVDSLHSAFNISTTRCNREVAEWADVLILAVEPGLHGTIIEEISESTKKEAVVITIAAGITLEFLEKAFGRSIKAVRVMPNTPSLVGEGMSALCANQNVTEEELSIVVEIFESCGRAVVLEERLMDAVPAISGSSPAYAYMFIEALADGGVKSGLPRELAYKMAAQAVLGAAKMVLETGLHPGILKDQVCTPGGSTIEAVAELEKQGFRASVLSAMDRCTEKVKKLSGE